MAKNQGQVPANVPDVKEAENKNINTVESQPVPHAEFKYIGDDGGRWLFQRRYDGICITIDKPKNVTLNMQMPPFGVTLTVRGKKFNEDVLRIVRH